MTEEMGSRNLKKKASLTDIAAAAGVSKMTVSRYLNPRKRMEVASVKRAKIEMAMQKLDYTPNIFARKRRAIEKYRIGILTSLSKHIMQSGYHMGLLSGILDRVFRTGHELDIFQLKENFLYNRLEEILSEHGVDGLLIVTWRMDRELIKLVEKTSPKLPLVVFNDYYPKLNSNILYVDPREGMKLSVSYLAEKGYRKIGFLTRPSEIIFKEDQKTIKLPSVDGREKLQGFIDAMKEKKLTVRNDWIRECISYKDTDSYNEMKEWIKEGKLPRAIICANDEMALGAMKALKEAKLWCPEKIALVGYDDIERGRVVSPSLTTIRQPLYQMGQESVDVLIEKIEFQDKEPVQRRYVPELIARQTA